MLIYIDEAGSFTTFPESRNSISCVAALVIADSVHGKLLEEYQRLVKQWGLGSTEVKGRFLSERHFEETIRTVFQSQGAFLRVAAIDIGIHTLGMIDGHKKRQAEQLRKPMDNRFNPEFIEQVYRLASEIEELPPQLYVQFILLTQLVVSVIQTSTLLFSQLEPSSLSKFCWRVDAKDRQVTKHEQLWKTLVLPFIQSATLRSQIIFLTEGDYSYFKRFENPDQPTAPEHLRDTVAKPDEKFSSFSVNKVLEDLQFVDSRSSIGVQLVDVLANCFRRASNHRLQEKGWQNLGRIIVRDPRTDLALEICSLSHGVTEFYSFHDMPYAKTLDHIAKTSRGYLIR